MKGQCLCGAVSISVPQNENVHVCHCNMCQRWNGGPLFAFHCEEIEVEGNDLPNGRSGHFASTAALTFIIICLARKVMKSLAAYSLCKPISHWKMKSLLTKNRHFTN